MKRAFVFGGILLASATALAGGPEYRDDPFGDSDFAGTPLILDTAHPTRGRAEVATMFSSSVIDKYSSHMGAMLDVNYHLLDSVGVGFTFGFLHGQLTPIVTDPEGIIGNEVKQCVKNPGDACTVTPDVPDLLQITGVVTALGYWSPLYGKINIVSELDVNLQLYFLFGLGVNGTRMVGVQRDPGADTGYVLSNNKVGEGGPFSGTKVHVAAGGGLRIFMANWVDLRLEFRDLTFRDEFEFRKGDGKIGYFSNHYFAQAGLGFILF